MEHTVSIMNHPHRQDSWVPMATFAFHVDALHYARRLSNQDHLNRAVRVEGSNQYVNVYYRRGEEIVKEGAE